MADHRGGGQDRPLLLGVRRQRASPTPPGSRCPIVSEEMCWGDAGIALAIFGSTLARRRHHRQRHARADRRVGAAVLRHAREDPARRVRRERARRRLRRAARCGPAPSTTRPRTSGCSTAPRRGSPTAASPTSTSSSLSVDPELGARGQASFVVPPGHARARAGPEVQEARHPRQPHRRGRPRRRAASPARCLLGGKEKLDERLARAREGKSADGRRRRWRRSRRPARSSARRPSASPAPPTSTRSTTPRSASSSAAPIIENQAIAFKLADMKTEIDAARLLVWRAAWMGKTGKRVRERRGLDEQAQGRRDRGVGHRGGDPDPRRLRLRPRVPGRALAPRREDLHDLRGHLRDPAPGHRPRHLRRAHQRGLGLRRPVPPEPIPTSTRRGWPRSNPRRRS